MAQAAWKTPKFKELLSEWNEKLYQTGFEDHETKNRELKKRASNAYYQADRIERETRLSYYLCMDSAFHRELCSGAFGPPISDDNKVVQSTEYLVLQSHCEGRSAVEIAREIGIERKTVRYIIRRYQHEWGVRFWTRKQMRLK